MIFPITLYWIRHAPTEYGKCYNGHRPIPCIAPTGYDAKEAKPLTQRGTLWHSSDLPRAQMTAQWLLRELGQHECLLNLDPQLREQHFGQWEGRDHDSVQAEYPDLPWHDLANIKPPEGESFAQLCILLGQWLERELSQTKAQNLVIVAHAGTIRAGIAHALGITPAQALRLQVDPGSISQVKYYDTYSSSGSVGYLNRPLLTAE